MDVNKPWQYCLFKYLLSYYGTNNKLKMPVLIIFYKNG